MSWNTPDLVCFTVSSIVSNIYGVPEHYIP